jgi:hypothetical protein
MRLEHCGCGGARVGRSARFGSRVRARRGIQMRYVGACGQLDAQFARMLLIVEGETLADFAGGDADDGVCVGSVLNGTVKHGDPERPLFQVVRATREGLLDDIPKKRGVALAVAELVALKQLM